MEIQTERAPVPATASGALAQLLDELEQILIGIDSDAYRARVLPGVSGSIGEHVRHCLDHVSALLSANPSATLSYDRRHRGTVLETDPAVAIRQILDCRRSLDAWASRSLDEPVRVSSVVTTSGGAVIGWSTLGRELAFVLSHTIHHQALIAVLLAIHGYAVPHRFGYAPSTPRVN